MTKFLTLTLAAGFLATLTGCGTCALCSDSSCACHTDKAADQEAPETEAAPTTEPATEEAQ